MTIFQQGRLAKHYLAADSFALHFTVLTGKMIMRALAARD
jgi:hypothetical protein